MNSILLFFQKSYLCFEYMIMLWKNDTIVLRSPISSSDFLLKIIICFFWNVNKEHRAARWSYIFSKESLANWVRKRSPCDKEDVSCSKKDMWDRMSFMWRELTTTSSSIYMSSKCYTFIHCYYIFISLTNRNLDMI